MADSKYKDPESNKENSIEKFLQAVKGRSESLIEVGENFLMETRGKFRAPARAAAITLRSVRESLTGFIGSEESLNELRTQKQFAWFKHALGKYGQFAGTGHKRILIPKSILTKEEITDTLGFEPVKVAIPEAGQDKFESYRHIDMNYHLHSHKNFWTMHLDEHAASTMRIRKAEKEAEQAGEDLAFSRKVGEFFGGLPHVVTEGIPGAFHYLRGQLFGTADMADRVGEELPGEYLKAVNRLGKDTEAGYRKISNWKKYNTVPGKDDAYNTIEGLSEKGMAAKMRKENTDFGSGYQRDEGITGTNIIGGATSLFAAKSLLNTVANLRVAKGYYQGYFDLYHGTNIKNVKSMVERGIVPNASDYQNMFKLWGSNPRDLQQRFLLAAMEEKAERVFFSSHSWVARAHAVMDDPKEFADPTAAKGPYSHNMAKGGGIGYYNADVQGGSRKGVIFKLRLPADKLTPQSGLNKQFIALTGNTKAGNALAEVMKSFTLSAQPDIDISHLGKVTPDQLLSYTDTETGMFRIVGGKSVAKSATNWGKVAKHLGMASAPIALGALGLSMMFSGKDDEYNTIEGLRHEGIAGRMRKEMTDFGSGWIRRAISKGVSSTLLEEAVKRSGKSVVRTARGEIFARGRMIGEGGMGEVFSVQSLRTGKSGVYKTAKKGKGTMDKDNIFGPRTYAQEIQDPFQLAPILPFLEQFSKQIHKSAGGFKNFLHYEAAMQKAAHRAMPEAVPSVLGITEEGFIQQYAGRALRNSEKSEAAAWIKKVTTEMGQGNTPVMHLDLSVGNIVKSPEGGFKLIDWGVSAPSKNLRDAAFLEDYQKFINKASNTRKFQQSHVSAIKTASFNSVNPGKRHQTKSGTLVVPRTKII